MARKPKLSLLEWVDRRERITTSGTEIVATIYCEPASSGPMVIAALLGYVTGNTINSKRVLPIQDPVYSYCYCVEAHRKPMDPRVVANDQCMTPSEANYDANAFKAVRDALLTRVYFDGPRTIPPNGGTLYAQPEDKKGKCGCYIEAIFRPLLTAYSMSEDLAFSGSFDYVDPQFFPCYRTFNNNNALYALPDINPNHWLTKNYKIGEETQFTETWQEITIRRLMCPTVPWQTINKLTNTINFDTWTPWLFTLPSLPSIGGVKGFPPGTLRFDGCTPTKRITPSVLQDDNDETSFKLDSFGNPICKQNISWDITLKFSWRTIWNWWIDVEGVQQDPGWITWNMQFGGPFGKLLASPAAWYDTYAWSFFPGTSSLHGPNNNSFGQKYRFDKDIGITNNPNMKPFDFLFFTDQP